MDNNIQYITQIKKSDLRDMADLANIQAGNGIIIQDTPDGLIIDLAPEALMKYIDIGANVNVRRRASDYQVTQRSETYRMDHHRIQNVTDLTSKDLKLLSMAVNMQGGVCVRVSRTGKSIEISVDDYAVVKNSRYVPV